MKKNIMLRKQGYERLRSGHVWIYRTQIEKQSSDLAPGELVQAYYGTKPMGIGYINPLSEITFRLLESDDRVQINQEWICSKIKKAMAHRQTHVRGTNSYRLINSEADGLPGLIIDCYDQVLVFQILTAGMEAMRALILKAIDQIFPERKVYEKSEGPYRKKEGLEHRAQWIVGGSSDDKVRVTEDDITYEVSLTTGQKTGHYLDQRENRLKLKTISKAQNVLDVFSNTGGFGLHLAKLGMNVTAIESQDAAVAGALINQKLNNIPDSRYQIIQSDAFDQLRSLQSSGQNYDLIILDPPSFVRSKSAVEGAMKGYKELILQSLKLLSPRGIVAVYSCSYHISEGLLMQAALSAAFDVQKKVCLLEIHHQSKDHPMLPHLPETCYLKGLVLKQI